MEEAEVLVVAALEGLVRRAVGAAVAEQAVSDAD